MSKIYNINTKEYSDYTSEYENFCTNNENHSQNDFKNHLSNSGSIIIKTMSPSEYAAAFNITEPISDNISIERFDEIVADNYNAWNYPLDEYDDAVENSDNGIVIVTFNQGERIVQLPQ